MTINTFLLLLLVIANYTNLYINIKKFRNWKAIQDLIQKILENAFDSFFCKSEKKVKNKFFKSIKTVGRIER